MQPEELIESIYDEFQGFQMPPSATNHPGCPECNEYAEDLDGVDRRNLTMQQIGTVCWGPIPFLTPAAMAYYFPRLAEFAIGNAMNKEGDPFRDQFMYAVRDSQSPKFSLFGETHRRAVLRILKFLEDEWCFVFLRRSLDEDIVEFE